MVKLENEADFLMFVAKVSGADISELAPNTEFRSLSTWSSLNALYLITRISEEQEVFITSSELAKCNNLKDIHTMILSKTAANQ